MAGEGKSVDGVDDLYKLFPPGSAKMLERLLARAAETAARRAGLAVKAAFWNMSSASRARSDVGRRLAVELHRALRHRGATGSGRRSVRQTAPDTGGRPFHFAVTVVAKSGARASTSRKKGLAGSGKTGTAAAHMRYIEREAAVESLNASGREIAERDRGSPGRPPPGRQGEREIGQDRGSAASPGQAYVENPVKLESGEKVLFSFGTIGVTFEERLAFWEDLEKAEAHPDARVQHRLIVELPHEATPQARFEMVKKFTKRFEDDGVPFWAALHAPGGENDSRNFHAHVVYSERPAKRMVDPTTGLQTWDFAIFESYTKKSRNRVERRPYRQTKLRLYNNRDFIPNLRASFSTVVNTILDRDDVRDASGERVRYDPRSYASMGLNVVPMRSIDRIVADKLRGGQRTVLDGDYTKDMIAAELREAVAQRNKVVIAQIALDETLTAAAKARRPSDFNKVLPRELRISPLAIFARAPLRATARKLLEVQNVALNLDVMERGTIASLERVITATSPKAVAAATKSRDPLVRAEAPSPDSARMLHDAAVAELTEVRQSSDAARSTMRSRVNQAVSAWKALVAAPDPGMSSSMKRIIDRATEPRNREHATKLAGHHTDAGHTTSIQHDVAADTDRRQHTKDLTHSDEPSLADRHRPTAAATPGTTEDPTKTRSRPAKAQPPTPVNEQGIRRPATAADAAFARLPTSSILAEASQQVSAWIKIIVDREPDVDKRMQAIQDFSDDLTRMTLNRKRRERAASEAARSKGTAENGTKPTAIATPSAAETPPAAPTPEAPIEILSEGNVPATGSEPNVRPIPMETTTSEDEVAFDARAGVDDEMKKKLVGGQPKPAEAERGTSSEAANETENSESTEEHPSDAERRKRRKRDLEKRKQMRKAVLAKRRNIRTR